MGSDSNFEYNMEKHHGYYASVEVSKLLEWEDKFSKSLQKELKSFKEKAPKASYFEDAKAELLEKLNEISDEISNAFGDFIKKLENN